MSGKKRRQDDEEMVQCPVLLTKKQKEQLDKLWKTSRIPRNVLMREAVEDLLRKYEQAVEGS
jgi:hypothetical protein